MSCCSESGELFIYPAGDGAQIENLEAELERVSGFDDVVDPEDLSEHQWEQLRRLPRPWVARVSEEELEDWVERLGAHPEIAVACPNWGVSLTGTREPGVPSIEFDPRGVDSFLEANCPSAPAAGMGRDVHVAVVDSGVGPAALPSHLWAGPQLDFAFLGKRIATRPFDAYGHGSLVGSLIHRLAPDARISSIRVFRGKSATLADVVYGLLSVGLLAEQVDIVNLSLSVRAATATCQHCGLPVSRSGDARAQVGAILEQLALSLFPCPVFVAAAGTQDQLAAPASLPGVIAVDALDSLDPLAGARTRKAVGDEFVLAPGGSQGERIDIGATRFFGSSFATAVATGFLARDAGALAPSKEAAWQDRPPVQGELLDRVADNGLPGYRQERHGHGVIR